MKFLTVFHASLEFFTSTDFSQLFSIAYNITTVTKQSPQDIREPPYYLHKVGINLFYYKVCYGNKIEKKNKTRLRETSRRILFVL